MRSYSNSGKERHSRLTWRRLENDGPMTPPKKADERIRSHLLFNSSAII